ncbi:MAG TPA: DedA family protein [Nodosilinea sp.]|nr:DedA family protein [Nodosilinea sp.]
MLTWITDWLESFGYAGIFALMVLEHLFPPIPSEVIMPFAGFLSSRQPQLSLPLVIVSGSLGSLVGTLAWYVLGQLVSLEQVMAWTDRHGHWLAFQPKDIQKALTFFQEGSGHWAVGLGRIIPGIRTYVSLPAGLSHMPLLSYLTFSALGTVFWTGALAIAGYLLGEQFDRVSQVIAPISKGVLISLVLLIFMWVVHRYSHRPR